MQRRAPRVILTFGFGLLPRTPNASATLEQFGAPRRKLTLQDLQTPDNIYQVGVAPHRIDLLTSITGVEFEDAWINRTQTQINGINVSVIGREELLKNKRATGRPKDLADIAWLEQAEP
jgi:hypothetical protein